MTINKAIQILQNDVPYKEIVSIVMPVHNTPASCLRRAVDSVVAQTYRYFELIVVDDGSDDINTLNELKKMEGSEKGVRVFRVEHLGVSGARNYGIQHAIGTWLAFLDSDDELVLSFLSEALQVAHSEDDCDLVIAGCRRLYSAKRDSFHGGWSSNSSLDYQVVENAREIALIQEDMLALSSVKRSTVPQLRSRGPVSKLYRMDRIQEIRFDTELQQGEDRVFNYQYLDNCRKACLVNTDWYFYYQNEWSAVHSRHSLEYWKRNIDKMLSIEVPTGLSSALAASVCSAVLVGVDGWVHSWSSGDYLMAVELFTHVRDSGCLNALDIDRYAFPLWRKRFYEYVRDEKIFNALLLLGAKRLFNVIRRRGQLC